MASVIRTIRGVNSPGGEEDGPPWLPWKRTSPTAEVEVEVSWRRFGLLRSLEVAPSDVM